METWELSKENFQPLKKGRAPASLALAPAEGLSLNNPANEEMAKYVRI